jgi:hypothetical protein
VRLRQQESTRKGVPPAQQHPPGGNGTPPATKFDEKAYQQCMSPFQNSTVGKVVQFGSLLSFVDNAVATAKLWGEAITVKFLLVQAFDMGPKSAGGTGTPVGIVKPVIGKLATAGMALASTTDAMVRVVCASGADPGSANAALSAIP